MISLKQLVQEACPGGADVGALPDTLIKGIECDSRKIEKDTLFVAIRGNQKDGNEFIQEALSRGAAAVVTDQPREHAPGQRPAGITAGTPFLLVPECRSALANLASVFYGHPSRAMRIIGVTGTNGKTTSTYLIEHLLKGQNKSVGVIGTVSYRFGDEEVSAAETTPGPLRIQQLLAEMRDARCEVVVMEVSSHALDQNRVGGIDFGAALFTNLTQDHLDYHKTLDAYFECKSRLFSALSPEKPAILNADDPWTEKLKKKILSKVITYGIERPSDLKAAGIENKPASTSFRVEYQGQKFLTESPLIGLHNVYNVLGALAVMAGLGFDIERAARQLESFQGVPGRLEAVTCGQNFLVFVDFAHTPDGLENVLSTLKPYRRNKLTVVFGCGGDRDPGKRPTMAAIASRYCDHVYVTSDNPRSEDPKKITQEVCRGFPDHFKEYTVVLDRKKAIRQALLSARREDIVLLAGKGHETTQVFKDQTIPFSDKKEAERVLNGY